MSQELVKLIQDVDITGRDPKTGEKVGGDIFIYTEPQREVKVSIAFRRGCGIRPITCVLFDDEFCGAVNITSVPVRGQVEVREEEGAIGPDRIICGETMVYAGLLVPALEVLAGFREETAEFIDI